MTNREQLVDALFAEAVDLSDSERELFFAARLAEQGAEPALLDELKALLTNYRRANANEFLNQPLVSGDAQTLNEGQEFEGYRIARLIGEGGMCEVYLAEDPELKRKVALKLIKGHATKDILRRFQSERQILANLKHANIAQLYEAGATADGLPFFAMEYVEGDPIDKFVADCGLTLNEGLKLFATVCSAISYAHQNLIIHRDIKPGNILVTKNGEPKLLDFGIAKLLQDESEPDATASMFRALTPQYASPEQIKGEPITTASDIYSLGTLLYELVTGQRPYRLKGNTAAEITKAICEQDPTKPSNVRNDAESGRRGDTEKKQISASPRLRVSPSALRGDLDNIILKALRKEPSRRYASVEQFSEDIRRHLEGLPVTAHKDSFAYRTTKFIKRNKIAVAAALMILLTLTAGIIATTVQARRANRRFNQARQLAHTILFDYHDEIAALPGSTKVRERMVKDALQYLDSLSQDAGNDVSLLREVAIGYEKTATVQGGGGSHVKAYGRYQSIGNLGDTRGALASMQKALAIRLRVVAFDPGNRQFQQDLAYCYEGLANLYSLAGPPEKVIEYSDKAIPLLEGLLKADPTNEDDRAILGNTYTLKSKALGNPVTASLGDVAGAWDYLNKALPILERLADDYPADPEYQRNLGAVYNLASLLSGAKGDEKKSLELNEKAIDIDRRLVNLDPNNSLFKSELAIQTGNAGSTMLKLGDAKGAQEKFKQALAIYESMIAADPNDAATHRNAAVGYRNVGVAIGADDRVEAMKNFSKALDIFAGLAAKDSTNADFRRQWAYTY